MYNWASKFSGLVSGAFPTITAKNASGPTAQDGTPFTADFINDFWGWMQDLLNSAGLTPNGMAEASGSSQILQAFRRGGAQRPGDVIYTAIPTAERRAQNRLIDLNGQIIPITGAYSRLADNIYAGDSTNDTVPSFYKCDVDGNRTTSGAYMKLPDLRGLFIRSAGVNGTYTAANGAPYDGKDVGRFNRDTVGPHAHTIPIGNAAAGSSFMKNWTTPVNLASCTWTSWDTREYNTNETAPASSSLYAVMTY